MRSKPFCLILLLCIINFCKAQDSTIVLDTSMFDMNFQTIALTGFNGWIFKDGNDTTRANIDLDTKGWIKFNPVELSIKNADNNGKVEGWFRLKFRLDSSFKNFPVGLQWYRFAASDIYVDGQHVASFGNTGLDGKPYREFRGTLEPPVDLNLKVNTDHVLAIHVVDYGSPLNSSILKTELIYPITNAGTITLTATKAYSRYTSALNDKKVFYTFLFCVCGILSILFWLLYFQNSNEKNLIPIALSTTLFSAANFIDKIQLNESLSSFSYEIYFYAKPVVIGPVLALIIIILSRIFKQKITIPITLLCVVNSFAPSVDFYFFAGRYLFFVLAVDVCVCLYLIVISWRNLRGPQWSVVVGIVFTFAFAFLEVSGLESPYLYVTGLFLSFPLSLMVYVSGRFKEILNEVRTNANEILKITEEKKEILAHQNELLEKQVEERTRELKASQAQLIQAEKMASLGELTAGIAHEIQNPLNFVNNFSEVNKELLTEMKDEMDKGNLEDAKEIANDVIANEQKINHHGKRAGDIVKGMLQRSRNSSIGIKEPTDINKLADEYLRLAYHGLRAKDKSFNATLKTKYDESIGNINIIPQDIGRVMLNLINNAFYAVNEKQKAESLKQEAESKMYEPTVSVITKKEGDKIIISVKDNGNGIPQKVVDKIFQPFFTTKPTGQGTGLGLSLSYDIIKAHGGEIKVETKEGEGATFIIQLTA